MSATKHILIVDDNPANLKLASDLLEIDGFKVTRCVDANEVIETLKTVTPDLILMDIGLPGMDGMQLTGIIKGNTATARIKVVALTAFAMKGDKDRILASGCDGYITKPIDTRKFVSQLDVYLK
jgi:CheY-like chemotaxis protein